MDAVKVTIVRYADPGQPGWIECSLRDAWGQEWAFVERVPVVSDSALDKASEYPRFGRIACEVIGQSTDAKGRAIFTVSTDKPWGVSSTTGKHEFDVWASQLTVLPSPFLWDAFRDGAQFKTGHQLVRMRCQEIGAIHFSTGHIVACDPISNIHTRPFSRRVEPDSYDVFLAIADYGRDQRVAAAMILFAHDTSPCRWEHAGEADAGPQSGVGYSVDSGRGCFLDLQVSRFLLRKAERGRLERYQRLIESQFDEHCRPTWSWANAILDEASGGNVVAFTTAMGDGSYASFLGFDDKDRLVCLVTDFGLLDGANKAAI